MGPIPVALPMAALEPILYQERPSLGSMLRHRAAIGDVTTADPLLRRAETATERTDLEPYALRIGALYSASPDCLLGP